MLKCIREMPRKALSVAMETQRKSRAAFGLPEALTKDPQGFSRNRHHEFSAGFA